MTCFSGLKRFFIDHFKPTLFQVSVEPTNDCNLHCKICESRGKRKIGYMKQSVFKMVIDELASLSRSPTVTLSFFGESLLHPHFNNFLQYAIQKKLQVSFHTNGSLMNKLEIAPNKAVIMLSDHGLPIADEYLAYFSVVDIVDGDTTHTPRYWLSRGLPVHLHARITEDLNFVDAKHSVSLGEKRKHCRQPFTTAHVLWNGDVTLCCHDGNGLNVVGNVRDGLLNIWHSRVYTRIRKEILKHHKPRLPLCQDCMLWQYTKRYILLKA